MSAATVRSSSAHNVTFATQRDTHVDESVPVRDDNESVDSATIVAKELGLSVQYERQVTLMNQAIKEEIGFGSFQVKLAILAGFGWLADNVRGRL